MTNIRVTCQSCGAVALLRPAQILLLAEPDGASGDYLFGCPMCQCLTSKSAEALELQVLISAGVADARGGDQPDTVRPRQAADTRPFTSDDLLDFHFLLAEDDWFSRLA